jgi:hypothetical protein
MLKRLLSSAMARTITRCGKVFLASATMVAGLLLTLEAAAAQQATTTSLLLPLAPVTQGSTGVTLAQLP